METKVCSKCGKELSVNNFSERKDAKNGLRADCKECRGQTFKKWYEDNKEHKAEYHKKWYKDNKEHLTEYRKQYCYGKRNKAVAAEYDKKYRQEHLEERRVCNHHREAQKRLLPSTLTIQQWENIKLYFNNECAYCGRELPLEKEHLISVNKGGEYTHNNIICACQSCNSSKGNRDFTAWFGKHEYYSKERENKILKYLGYEKGIQQLSIL